MATSEPEDPAVIVTKHWKTQSPPEGRPPPFARSIGLAVLVWAGTLVAVYLPNQSGPNSLAGLVVPAGFIFGIWFGGRYGGMRGGREWGTFVVRLLGVTFLLFGLGSCVYAMALYG